MQELLNKEVIAICGIYIYAGILKAVDSQCIALTEAQIVYVTGSWDEREFTKAERLPGKKLFIPVSSIESLQERK